MVEIEDLYGKSSMKEQSPQNSDSEEERLNEVTQSDIYNSASWYDRFMMFKPLGYDKFDKQVLALIQMNPEQILSLVFSSEPDDDEKIVGGALDVYSDLHGKDINVIHLACQEGLSKTLEYILTTRPDMLDFKSAAGWTPLMTACEAGQIELIDAILDGAEDEARVKLIEYTCQTGSPLHAAITGQKPLETVQLLIDKYEEISIDEAEPDYVEKMLNQKDESHIHPLFLSTFMGNTEVTKLLLTNGANPMTASDPNGVTLLHICAERGYTELTEVICKAAPKLIFESDLDGNTAFHVVCDWDYIEILKIFCDCIDSQLEASKANAVVEEDDHELRLKLKSPMKLRNK